MFTERELQLIRFYVEDALCTKDIAVKLGLSLHTCETHRTNIVKKLRHAGFMANNSHVTVAVQMALYAYVNGLVDVLKIQRKYTAEIPSPS